MELDNGPLFRSFEHNIQRVRRESSKFPRVDQVHETKTLIDYALIQKTKVSITVIRLILAYYNQIRRTLNMWHSIKEVILGSRIFQKTNSVDV